MKYSQITILPYRVEYPTAAEGDLAAKEFNLFDLNDLITALDKLSPPILTINHGEPLSEDNLFLTDLVIQLFVSISLITFTPSARLALNTTILM